MEEGFLCVGCYERLRVGALNDLNAAQGFEDS